MDHVLYLLPTLLTGPMLPIVKLLSPWWWSTTAMACVIYWTFPSDSAPPGKWHSQMHSPSIMTNSLVMISRFFSSVGLCTPSKEAILLQQSNPVTCLFTSIGMWPLWIWVLTFPGIHIMPSDIQQCHRHAKSHPRIRQYISNTRLPDSLSAFSNKWNNHNILEIPSYNYCSTLSNTIIVAIVHPDHDGHSAKKFYPTWNLADGLFPQQTFIIGI